MNSFSLLMEGFATALTPINLLYAVIGVILGTAVGVLPGIGPAMTVALLLPLTYDLEPTSAFIMFAGIYYGGMYGGSTTSILLNTPGRAPRSSPPSRATRWPRPARRPRRWRRPRSARSSRARSAPSCSWRRRR